MDVLALVIFLGVIILAFIRKINIGVLALAVGVLAVRVFGMTDSNLISGISSSMFTTLVGITLLFAVINSTGALELLARKIVALAGKRIWSIPIMLYISGFVIAGVGPGAIPALAIIPAMGISVALEVGYNPVMLALIGEFGLMAGRMTPITPEAAVITGAATSASIENVMPTILVCQTLMSIVFAIIVFVFFKGYQVKAAQEAGVKGSVEKFTRKQLIALVSIIAMLALIIFAGVNIGLSAFFVAAVLLLFGVADDTACLKALPWSTIVMVLGVGALMNIVDAAGGVDLMSNALSSIMTSSTAIPIMGISAGLLSFVSSALGVVYPTMMPMCVDVAAQVGGVNPVALMAAVAAGGSMTGISPMSTGGALTMAALATSKKDFSKEEQNKVFMQLLVLTIIALVVITVSSVLFFNIIANLMHG